MFYKNIIIVLFVLLLFYGVQLSAFSQILIDDNRFDEGMLIAISLERSYITILNEFGQIRFMIRDDNLKKYLRDNAVDLIATYVGVESIKVNNSLTAVSVGNLKSNKIYWMGNSGTYVNYVNVRLFTGESYVIKYTTDGSDPTINGQQYTNALKFEESLTLKVVSEREGVYGDVISIKYDIFKEEHPNNIFGKVTNKYGRTIVDVKVNLMKNSTIIAKTLTDQSGEYIFRDVVPGNYEIKVEPINYYFMKWPGNRTTYYLGGNGKLYLGDKIGDREDVIMEYGDINQDRQITVEDINSLANKYGTNEDDILFDVNLDPNSDRIIDLLDIVFVFKNLGMWY